MPDPADRQAATLAALDRQTEDARKLLCAAQRVHLALQEPRLLGQRIPGWGYWPDVERMMTALVAQAEGRRSTLRRHAPEWCASGEHWICACGFTHAWPDDDWRDAAADLDVG